MKRIFVIATVISALLAIGFVPIEADAAQEDGYVISMESDESVLSYSGQVLARGNISGLLSSVADGSSITFIDVESTSSIEIPRGSYAFSGDIRLLSGSIVVGDGAELLLSDFKMISSDSSSAALKVRGGALRIVSSEISCSGGAILSDYSQRGVTMLEDSTVRCSSSDGAITILAGSLSIKSGSIKNTLGAAIENRAEMTLCADPEILGVPTDIITDRAISLSEDDVAYDARYALRVVYDGVFSDGGAYEVFNKATEASISRITLFDKNGKSYILTYFASHPSFVEKSVAAVYLPFSLKFTDGAVEICTLYALGGESVTLPEAPKKEGYEFSFWSTVSGECFDASSIVSESVVLYPRYKLQAPTFKISTLDAVYTGEEHILAFSEVSHPLDALSGFCEFVWYRSGQIVSRGTSVALKNVSDSGEYSCLITYYYQSDSSSVLVDGISVTISPKQIDIPSVDDAVYDGTPKMPTGLDPTVFAFDVEGFTDVGVYQISLSLLDSENCVFSKTGLAVATVSFEITRTKNEFKISPSVKNVYEGMALDIRCEPLFGEVYFTFSKEREGEYTRTVPTLCGEYYLVACVDESKNYEVLVSAPIAFEIKEDSCISLEISAFEDRTYFAFDRFLGNGVLLTARYKSGREETVDASSLSVRYQRGNHLRYGDSGVILSYGGISTIYPLTVAKASYDLTSLDFSEHRITYDGKYHEYPIMVNGVVGKDNIPLMVSAQGGGTNAGEYKVRIVFSTESTDYNTPTERECTMIIERAAVELSWENLSFVYDGTKKKPTCSYTDVFGVVRYPEVYGEQTGAGVGYTAYVDSGGGNYSFIGERVEFEIKKADYDLASVRWIGGEYVYNGKEQSVTLVGLPLEIRVIGYTDACETDAGEYLAYATLAYDADNYNKPTVEPHAWSIHKASYDLSDFRVESDTVIFDGLPHYPKVIGNAPLGLDGIALQYRFSRAATHVAEGAVSIKVDFYTESQNYKTPDSEVVCVTVLPKAISVVWCGSEFTYSGREMLPSAECSVCEVEVLGSGVNAGEYTALAQSKNSDYYIENPSFKYKINKASNRFIGEISVGDVYTEREITYDAVALFGEPVMQIYSDPDCNVQTTITNGGKYYLLFTVAESENFCELRSEVIEVTAIELVITGVSVRILKDAFLAFERLSEEDFVLFASYNDGSEVECDISEIDIIYQTADSLRRSDTEVRFRFKEHETSASISVGYASYDLSSVHAEGLIYTFDGEEKKPTLVGLPDGVLLLGFLEGGAVEAGEYSFTPMFSYDAQNYLPPDVGTLKMVINKQIVPLRYQISVEYDGSYYIPTSDSSLYSLVSNVEIRDAGEYVVLARLLDDKNYAFSDGDAVTVSVLPRKIYVTVTEASMLPDGSFIELEYEIIDGSVIVGDDLAIYPAFVDGNATLKSDNANYDLIVNACVPVLVSRAMGDVKVTLITMGIALLVLLLAAVVYVGRRRIFGKAFAVTGDVAEKKTDILPSVKIIDVNREETEKSDFKPQKEEKSDAAEASCEPDEASSDLMERAEKIGKVEIDMEKADSLITDALARDLIKRAERPIRTSGYEKCVINVDTLSEYFYPGERVDINSLKKRGLVPQTAFIIKVLARGRVDKPLSVYANEFTPAAVKMIVLSGGEAVRAQTVKEKDE